MGETTEYASAEPALHRGFTPCTPLPVVLAMLWALCMGESVYQPWAWREMSTWSCPLPRDCSSWGPPPGGFRGWGHEGTRAPVVLPANLLGDMVQ